MVTYWPFSSSVSWTTQHTPTKTKQPMQLHAVVMGRRLIAFQNLHLSNCSSLQELPTSIGQLTALKTFWGRKNYLHLLANWVHSKAFIWIIVWSCKNYLHLLINWMHYKTFIWMIVRGYKNYVHLLVNWVHNKTLICAGVQACKNYLHLLGCSNLQKLPMYIGWFNALQTFICPGVWINKNYTHFLGNGMHVKSLSCWLNVGF
jgi:hypothetical protein